MEQLKCQMEEKVMATFKEKAGRKPTDLSSLDAQAYPLIWRIQGCQQHQKVKPCGNKEERGIPHGASCNACPLEDEVKKFTEIP